MSAFDLVPLWLRALLHPPQQATPLFPEPDQLALRERLRAVHGEIFDPAWWRDVQARLAAGEHFDVPPYPDVVRLPQAREPQQNLR